MKKIFAIIMTICLVLGAICIGVSALEGSTDDVIRVYGLKNDGTPMLLNGYTKFDEGWEAAVDYAEDHDFMDENEYSRIIVDLLADWNANDKGEFGESWKIFSDWGDGFQYSTIYVPSDTKITMNLNGHKINRGLTKYEHDGEVLYIGDDADLIINGGKSGDPIVEPDKDPGEIKTGTITGGFSCNGAGGIHMQGGSKLTLNNVNVVGNNIEDDDGAGIAVNNGATLIMNGGSIADNTVKSVNVTWLFGAGVYVENGTASFSNVIFKNNHSSGRAEHERDHNETYSTYGIAIYAENSSVTVDSCGFYDNGHHFGNFLDAESVIYASGGTDMTVKNTTFKGNGSKQYFTNGFVNVYLGTKLINAGACDLTIENCRFVENSPTVIFDVASGTSLSVSNTLFTDNNSAVYSSPYASKFTNSFVNCTFDKNSTSSKYPKTFMFADSGAKPTFTDCNFGNSSFNDRTRAIFEDSDADNGTGSIFGTGSFTMIVAFVALVASAASIAVNVSARKKGTCPSAENAFESEDME